MMIIDDTARCSLRPVTNDEPVVLMAQMRHSLFYLSMPTWTPAWTPGGSSRIYFFDGSSRRFCRF